MNRLNTNINFEKWLWIELIGFDNEKQDFGIGQFIDKAGFVPNVISLLLFNPDFVHTHNGIDKDGEFPDDFCSYYGHKYCEERPLQTWTKYQLKGLIETLQKRNVKVYMSVFDFFASEQWIGKHPEILHVTKDGTSIPSVCPWKRLSDGSYYEDFFVKKLTDVMKDYGFDGFHGADGYGHSRLYLNQGDFSDDMVEQFLHSTGVLLPKYIAEKCDGKTMLFERRANWIWASKRREWIGFYVARIRTFWQKVILALHVEGKFVVLNSAKTRDPLEAIYRCGIDYKGLVDDGVDGFVVETAATAAAMVGFANGNNTVMAFADFMAMGLLNKACMPGVPLRFLNGVKDTLEEFHCLRHLPTLLEREILTLSNLFLSDADGKLKRCYSGPVVCLADSITADEWKWLGNRWDIGFSFDPERILGATIVWSDNAFANQLEDYIETRKWTSHRLIQHLILGGAPILSIVNINHLEKISGTILMMHPNLLPKAELKRVLAYRNGPIIMIGGSMAPLPKGAIEFEDVYPPDQLSCRVYGNTETFEVNIETDGPENLPSDLFKDVAEPLNFLYDLYFRKVSESFLQNCVNAIHKCVHGVKIMSDPKNSTRVMAMQSLSGQIRLLIANDNYPYSDVELDMGREIRGVNVLNGAFNGPHVGKCPFLESLSPVQSGSRFKVKVPPIGMLVVDVDIEVG